MHKHQKHIYKINQIILSYISLYNEHEVCNDLYVRVTKEDMYRFFFYTNEEKNYGTVTMYLYCPCLASQLFNFS